MLPHPKFVYSLQSAIENKDSDSDSDSDSNSDSDSDSDPDSDSDSEGEDNKEDAETEKDEESEPINKPNEFLTILDILNKEKLEEVKQITYKSTPLDEILNRISKDHKEKLKKEKLESKKSKDDEIEDKI